MREKWLLCGPLNPRREEFLLTAETYVAGYRDLAQKQFKARFDMAMPRDKINKSAPPLVPGFTFSRRYSADLLKHSELHELFNPTAPITPEEDRQHALQPTSAEAEMRTTPAPDTRPALKSPSSRVNDDVQQTPQETPKSSGEKAKSTHA